MSKQLAQLRDRVLDKRTDLTIIMEIIREFSCIGEIIGRDFEVRNPEGEIVYLIRQKPMALKQMNLFIKEFIILKELDYEREVAKWGGMGKGSTRNKSGLKKRGR